MEKEVCLSTGKFEDFISELLNRTFQMIEILANEMSESEMFSIENDTEQQEIGLELSSTFTAIVQQCSEPIFRVRKGRRCSSSLIGTSSDHSRENYQFRR